MRFLPISFADGIALHSDQSLDAFLISRWLSMWDTCQLQVHGVILGSINSTFQRWSLRWQKTDANIHQPVIQKITFRCKLYCICESVTTWSIFKLHARAGAIQECRRSWLMKKKNQKHSCGISWLSQSFSHGVFPQRWYMWQILLSW